MSIHPVGAVTDEMLRPPMAASNASPATTPDGRARFTETEPEPAGDEAARWCVEPWAFAAVGTWVARPIAKASEATQLVARSAQGRFAGPRLKPGRNERSSI